MRKEIIVCSIMVIVSLVLCVAGYALLPDVVAIQVGVDGSPSTAVPKLLALIIPFGITLISLLACWLRKEKKAVAFSVIGVLVGAITLLINRS